VKSLSLRNIWAAAMTVIVVTDIVSTFAFLSLPPKAMHSAGEMATFRLREAGKVALWFADRIGMTATLLVAQPLFYAVVIFGFWWAWGLVLRELVKRPSLIPGVRGYVTAVASLPLLVKTYAIAVNVVSIAQFSSKM